MPVGEHQEDMRRLQADSATHEKIMEQLLCVSKEYLVRPSYLLSCTNSRTSHGESVNQDTKIPTSRLRHSTSWDQLAEAKDYPARALLPIKAEDAQGSSKLWFLLLGLLQSAKMFQWKTFSPVEPVVSTPSPSRCSTIPIIQAYSSRSQSSQCP